MPKVIFAKTHDFNIPATYKEFIKFADPIDVKQFESFKNGKTIEYYLDEAIKSEENAIKAYTDALNEIEKYDSEAAYDFSLILNQILFDEVEHLQTFTFIKTQLDAFNEYM